MVQCMCVLQVSVWSRVCLYFTCKQNDHSAILSSPADLEMFKTANLISAHNHSGHLAPHQSHVNRVFSHDIISVAAAISLTLATQQPGDNKTFTCAQLPLNVF